MNMSIRHRLYILSFLPVLIVSVALMFEAMTEAKSMSADQISNAHKSMLEMKQTELRSYLEIADSVLLPLKQAQAPREEVISLLRNIKFDGSGYLFGYDTKGVRLLLGQSETGIGENFYSMQDARGNNFIQELINNAKEDKFTTYYFPKPGSTTPIGKLSYSIYLPEWDLVIGAGFYIDDVEQQLVDMDNRATDRLEESLWTLISISAVVTLIVIVMSYFMNRSIMRPLELFSHSIRSFASGDADLTARMESFKAPEFNNLSKDFNTFVDSLQVLIKQVRTVSQQVVEESVAMNQRASESAQLSSGQQKETEQVATAMTEMTTTAEEISNNASQAAESARTADDNVNVAHKVVVATANSVSGLSEEIAQASIVISRLEGDVKNIASSLDVIQEIAEQTNLLALNAAIEAARAGDQGRGFAVVADEVRKLASRTQDSTGEIHDMIQRLKAASDDAVDVMGRSQKRSVDTVSQANSATDALQLIRDSVQNILDMNALIATATSQQSVVGQEISQRVVVISEQSERSAKLAEDNRDGSQNLDHRVKELYQLVARFKA
ncbi:methyl-accepting chemotaxis protein [Vibrio fluvialis]|uniref:Methyl-accepting chemotaxis protein n=2 Tax=Vibrio fluvialis TaxID=676 RepID=A0AAX2LY43_VIBFL|nr:methyl-accepting chemotaxis protein [Vibrio fluvialis]AMF92622.1 methyl-accepting chemotaxis protein [Vibrio fluvialis]EKO4008974.1 methyl-accepting chemotaxis protein [Vibrio fluvialis]EME3969441.1 cache domain-containing protein [Vibrio fluvialis]MBY8228466.1 methyl-accepting chemotaxis protein [Vibrio fluvialis]MCE7632650.1 methyl-accepting chemotaxis protein [Vibrio fluvialis]